MLIISNIGDHVWLITSRQTDPELYQSALRWRPCAGAGVQFIDVWMKDAIDEANARALVRVLVGKFHMDLPQATRKRSCGNGT